MVRLAVTVVLVGAATVLLVLGLTTDAGLWYLVLSIATSTAAGLSVLLRRRGLLLSSG